jgi:glutamine synthetase
LQFTDLLGIVKEIIIPVSQLEDAFENGVWFDGSSVEGFTRIQESDLFLRPNPSTYALVPWLKEKGRTARLICDIYDKDNEPFAGDPRGILKRAMLEAKDRGYTYNVGPELEFYLFKTDDDGNEVQLDEMGYFDQSSYQGFDFLRETIEALDEFGIEVETSHHEVGSGQYEIDFKFGPALSVADKVLTLKYTVKKLAQMKGLKATFMPKPIAGAAGSGMHIHQSLFDKSNKENLFSDQSDKYGLSEIAYQFLAAQMKHAKALAAIVSPTFNSYKRLVSGYEAPVYITWAAINRSALIRVPRWLEDKPQAARIELRCPDPSCNPYLAFATMLSIGLKGVEEKMTPPSPSEENIYEVDRKSLKENHIDVLPTSLYEALRELENNKPIKNFLGKSLHERYIEMKDKEWDEFKLQVTNWEKDKYSNLY